MTKPTVFPRWAENDLIDGFGNNNKVEPPEAFKLSGLNRGEDLSRAFLNYQFDLISDWITYFDGEVTPTSFPTVQDAVNSTELEEGGNFITYFYNSDVLCFWRVVAAGTGAGDMSDGTLDLVSSSTQAQLVQLPVMTPKHFGAYGDGTTDDTNPVQYCLDNSNTTFIDSPYAISSITATNYFTCVGSGKFVYVGGLTIPLTKVINLSHETFGKIYLDGNQQEFQGIVASDGNSYYGESIDVRNMYTPDLASNTPIAILITNGTRLKVDRVYGQDFTQGTGFDNGSVPQLLVASGLGTHIEVNDATGYRVRAGLLADNLSTISVNSYTHEESEDQAIYNFTGKTRVGNLYMLNSPEEVIVNSGGHIHVDNLSTVGRCFSFLRIDGAKYSYIGKVHSTFPNGTADADKWVNVCRGWVNHRVGNTGKESGDIVIGEITGSFVETLIRTGDGSGTSNNLQIGSCDIDFYYKDPSVYPAWDKNNWFTTTGCKGLNLKDLTIRIIDTDDVLTSSTSDYFNDDIYTTNLTYQSLVENMDVYVLGSNREISPVGVYRGERSASPLLKFKGAVWQTNIGAYRRNADLGQRDSSINETVPVAGYFEQGDVLTITNFDANNQQARLLVCTQTGNPGVWSTVYGDGRPLFDVIPPSSIPDYQGQMFIDSVANDVWIAKGTGSFSDWVKLT